MQRVENMSIGDGVIGAAAAAVLSWLAASVMKVSKSEFKELATRVALLEKDRITPEEFERRMGKLEDLVKEFRNEMKADFREIKAKV